MALKKRGKTWHCHFVVNGQRFRQSLETTDWREAQAKEKQLIAEASEGKLTANSTALARLPFEQAADDYVIARELELAPASRAKEKQLLVQLRAYFKQEPLKAITAKRITEYRTWRASQTKKNETGRHDGGHSVCWPRDAECRAWHPAPHPEASEALGACC